MSMIERLGKEFFAYARRYLSIDGSENIQLKIEHTRRVRREAVMICTALGTSGREREDAEIAALFHDIGRFEQFALYETFADSKSLDHARLGAEILTQRGFLAPLDQERRERIIEAVRLHNAPAIIEGSSLTLRILRDADKLDIYRVVLAGYNRKPGYESTSIGLGLPESTSVTPEVYRLIAAGEPVRYDQLRNLNDLKLLQAAWVTGCSFTVTLRAIIQRGYLEKLQGVMPDTPETAELFSSLRRRAAELIDSPLLPDMKQNRSGRQPG